MKTKILTAAFLAMSMAAPLSALAADVATIDVQELLAKTKSAIEARKMLDAETKKAEDELNAFGDVIRKRQQELQEKEGVLSSAKYAEEVEALRAQQREFRTRHENVQSAINSKMMTARQKVLTEIQKAAKEIAKAKGYSLVVDRSVVFYSDDAIDISGDVLKRLDD